MPTPSLLLSSAPRRGPFFPALLALLLAVPALGDVTIHCLDIGQGDATLVVSSSGQTMLIDGGDNGKGSGVIVPYMNSLGLGPLEYMVATHYHADHIGGLDEVFQQKGVTQAAYDRGWSYTTATYNQYALVVSSKRATINEGQVVDLGDGVTVTCLGLNGNGQLAAPFNDPDRENEYSIALLVECGDFDFFVAGDLIGTNSGGYVNIESSIAPEAGNIEVYQVDHHGSWTSSNSAFVNLTRPEVSVISLGDGNPYGHPHQEILDRLSLYGSFVYQTEAGTGGTLPPSDLRVVGGHVVITTDGYGDYFVDGDQYAMDEPDPTDVPLVAAFRLHGNFPNPFNPATSIAFETPHAGPARLSIYDLAGRLVRDLRFAATGGPQTVPWNGTDDARDPVSSGVYLYRLETVGGAGGGRLTLVK